MKLTFLESEIVQASCILSTSGPAIRWSVSLSSFERDLMTWWQQNDQNATNVATCRHKTLVVPCCALALPCAGSSPFPIQPTWLTWAPCPDISCSWTLQISLWEAYISPTAAFELGLASKENMQLALDKHTTKTSKLLESADCVTLEVTELKSSNINNMINHNDRI